MRSADVLVNGVPCGVLEELEPLRSYRFTYLPDYAGRPLSLTLPVTTEPYVFDRFPPYFDGLLPEGFQLDALLRNRKLDRTDYFGQLLAVGKDVVGHASLLPRP